MRFYANVNMNDDQSVIAADVTAEELMVLLVAFRQVPGNYNKPIEVTDDLGHTIIDEDRGMQS